MQNRMMAMCELGLRSYYDVISVAANNLANSSVPGFKRSDVNCGFKQELSNAEAVINGTGTNVVYEINVAEDKATSKQRDGNNSDLDKDTMMLADAKGRYKIFTTLFRGECRILGNAINGIK